MRRFNITVNGVSYDVEVEEVSQNANPAAAPKAAPAAAPKAAPKAAAPKAAAPVAGGEQVKAPMPGNVLDVKVSVGQKVKNGETLLILEAMKMENEIAAPCDGTVASINVSKGATVNTGDLMISLN